MTPSLQTRLRSGSEKGRLSGVIRGVSVQSHVPREKEAEEDLTQNTQRGEGGRMEQRVTPEVSGLEAWSCVA